MTKQRKEAEELIYKVFDALDSSKTNSDYYRQIFSKMSDDEFKKFCERRLPFRFHTEAFNIEPKLYEIKKAFDVIKVPWLEKVKLPYVYVNEDGEPVETQDALVIYINMKRMKQFRTKKSATAINTEKRDMKTGLLVGEDKGGKETDREFESLATMGLEYTMDEFARPKADAMVAKAQMSNAILQKGSVSTEDLEIGKADSIGKNLLNVYLIGSNIQSNLVDIDGITPLTAKNKQQKIERI